jgi:hypothetical protein
MPPPSGFRPVRVPKLPRSRKVVPTSRKRG